MASRKRTLGEGDAPELDMTPMLDVVFIMLIFFIVTSVFLKDSGLETIRPLVSQHEQQNPSVLVAVSENNTVWIDGDEYAVANAPGVLEGLKNENPLLEIVLQGDSRANIGTVMEVQAMMEELEIPVYISTEIG